MDSKGKLRSLNQLRLYHGYVKQLCNAGAVHIQLGDKVWRGNLHSIKHPQYLLKALNLELPCTNPSFPTMSQNKCHFSDATVTELNLHIEWLREVLRDNRITPFNEVAYEDA